METDGTVGSLCHSLRCFGVFLYYNARRPDRHDDGRYRTQARGNRRVAKDRNLESQKDTRKSGHCPLGSHVYSHHLPGRAPNRVPLGVLAIWTHLGCRYVCFSLHIQGIF